MSYVMIYGGMRLDLDEGAMRELKLRPGQHVPDDMVAECVRAQVRQAFLWDAVDAKGAEAENLESWAFSEDGDAAAPADKPAPGGRPD